MSIKLNSDYSVPKASTKIAIIFAIGIAAGLLTGLLISWTIAPLVAWDTGVIIFITNTWLRLRRFDAELVKQHALREDPSRVLADVTLLVASVTAIAAVAVLLIASSGASRPVAAGLAFLGVLSVVASWFMVQTTYTLKYAELYYSKPLGGVDFGRDKDPVYSDFAYLAFTIGMTYQVSDTSLQTRAFRTTALKHALLAFLMGTVIIATTINLIAGLGK